MHLLTQHIQTHIIRLVVLHFLHVFNSLWFISLWLSVVIIRRAGQIQKKKEIVSLLVYTDESNEHAGHGKKHVAPSAVLDNGKSVL